MGVLVGLAVIAIIVLIRHFTMRRWMTKGGNIDRLAFAMVAPLYLVIFVSTESQILELWASDPIQATFSLALLGSAFLFAWWVMAAMMRSFAAIAPDDPPARRGTPPD